MLRSLTRCRYRGLGQNPRAERSVHRNRREIVDSKASNGLSQRTNLKIALKIERRVGGSLKKKKKKKKIIYKRELINLKLQ